MLCDHYSLIHFGCEEVMDTNYSGCSCKIIMTKHVGVIMAFLHEYELITHLPQLKIVTFSILFNVK